MHSPCKMAKELRLLNQVNVAAPCPADWSQMDGDDQVRHCSLCRLNVYNLSEMSGEEAETFLQKQTGRVCVRYYQRTDGKVMTKDCPKGLKALRQRAMKRLALAASLVLTSLGCGTHGEKIKKATGLDIFDGPNVVMGKMPMTMGEIAMPPPAPVPVGKGSSTAKIGQVPVKEPSILMGEIAREK